MNQTTDQHPVWFTTDAITLAIVATQLSGSGHTIQIHSTLHSLCTWSPIDGDQLRSPSCSCWHLELQIQTRKHERRNVRAHCNVHLCLGTPSSLQCNVWVGLPATQVVHRPRVDKQIRPQSLESQFTENSSALPYSPTKGCVPCLLGEISRLQQFHFTYVHRVDDEHWTLNASLVPLLSNTHDSDRN